MAKFTMDNTEGFTAEQLAALNEAFFHNFLLAVAGLEDGAESDLDLIAQVEKTVADELLNNWVAQ